jgi:acetyl esterase/lipase
MQPMQDLMRAIRYIRKHAEELHVEKDKIMLCGFSAGAHACGSVAVHWQKFEESETGEYASVSAKPNAVILSYPVITSGDCAHRGSFTALLGADASEEELEYMSLEKQVTEDMPPCFLWQTVTDELVPVQNSFLFAQALQKKQIPYAFHAFSKGKHGLSLADEAWANEEFGEPYTLEQTFVLGQAVNDGTFSVPEEVKQALNEMAKMFTGQTKREKEQVNEEVKDWPELADEWIRTTL